MVAVCAIAAAFGVSSLASATGATHSAKSVTVKRVFIRGNKHPHFVAPKSIHAHDKLKIINQTDPSKIGPHTFSMVQQRFIPKSNKQQHDCFKKGHICRKIAHWHQKAGGNLVKAGRQGWDVEGSLQHRGDSWFTGNKPGTSYSQPVTADTSAGPTRLYFLCAIHPEMQGSINVLPAG